MVNKFIIAVPNESQRRWLTVLLRKSHRDVIVAECRCGAELIAAAAMDHDARIVFGLNFEDIDGVDVARILRSVGSCDRLTVLLDPDDAFSLLCLDEYGIRRFILEGQDDEVVLRVSIGERMEPTPLGQRMCDNPRLSRQVKMVCHLTPNHFQLVHFFSAGARDKDIARMTGRSVHTVRTQRKRIYATLGVRSIAGLCMTIAAAGLIRFTHGKAIRPGLRGPLAEQVRDMDRDFA